MNPITTLAATNFVPPFAAPVTSAAPQQPFKTILLDAIAQVNQGQHDADLAAEQLRTGADMNAAEVLSSLQKADMSLRLMLEVRDKLVQALEEVNNIRI